MSIQERIEEKLRISLMPAHIEVINESHMHNVPPGSESHFKLVVVASAFENKNRVRRQQVVHRILRDELAGSIHALTMRTFSPDEWIANGATITQSPECLGGGKTDG